MPLVLGQVIYNDNCIYDNIYDEEEFNKLHLLM